jgi:hypothetical protein
MTLIESLAALIEFELANYERLCGLKRKPQGELDRIENVLKQVFEHAEPGTHLAAHSKVHLRLSELYETARDRHWTPFEALHGYFNAHRYGTVARKFVLQDDAQRYWPKDGVTMLPSDVKDAMIFPSKVAAEAKQAEIFGRNKNGPRHWKVVEVEG